MPIARPSFEFHSCPGVTSLAWQSVEGPNQKVNPSPWGRPCVAFWAEASIPRGGKKQPRRMHRASKTWPRCPTLENSHPQELCNSNREKINPILLCKTGFFCAPPKKTQGHRNSRNRKLKKITQNSSKNLRFPAFLDQNLKDTFWKIAKSNSQGRKITHFFQINDVFKLKTKIFQRFPPKTQ